MAVLKPKLRIFKIRVLNVVTLELATTAAADNPVILENERVSLLILKRDGITLNIIA